MHALASHSLLVPLLALLALLPPGLGPGADERATYERKKSALELECAQRHLDLGLWCRDKGYVEAAEAQILEACEVSRGRHQHASACRSLLRRTGERFWKKQVEVSASRQKAIDKKLAKVVAENEEEWFELAEWAYKKGLEEEALEGFEALLDPDAPLEVDSKGRVECEAGKIPAACSELILEKTVRINGEPFLRTGMLELLPDVEELYEAATPALVVRSTGSLKEAEAFHALGAELVPRLEEELRMEFSRRPGLLLFPTRDEYEGYLIEGNLQTYRSVSGFADVPRFTTVVCTEGLEPLTVQGLVLHELSHLADASAFPQAMPAWYREGFAESFGGSGTFAWDGLYLSLGREMDAARLQELRRAGGCWPIARMVRIDPLSLWGSSREEALRFYAQCWAVYRYLSRDAPIEVRGRWDDWIAACKDAVVEFPPRPDGPKTPDELFQEHLGPVFDEIDAGLATWLEDR